MVDGEGLAVGGMIERWLELHLIKFNQYVNKSIESDPIDLS